MTGTTTETAIRTISKLKKMGYIGELNKKNFNKGYKSNGVTFLILVHW